MLNSRLKSGPNKGISALITMGTEVDMSLPYNEIWPNLKAHEIKIESSFWGVSQGRGKVFYVGGAVGGGGSQFLRINITPNRNRKSCYSLRTFMRLC